MVSSTKTLVLKLNALIVSVYNESHQYIVSMQFVSIEIVNANKVMLFFFNLLPYEAGFRPYWTPSRISWNANVNGINANLSRQFKKLQSLVIILMHSIVCCKMFPGCPYEILGF